MKIKPINAMPSNVLVMIDSIIAHCVSQIDTEVQRDYINGGGEREGRTAALVYYIQKYLHRMSDRVHANCKEIQDNDPNYN